MKLIYLILLGLTSVVTAKYESDCYCDMINEQLSKI